MAKGKKGSLSDVAFQKVKKKVGKKQVSSTATKTDFRTRMIQMPSQTICEDKGDVVTSRHLTLKDLLSHLTHYKDTMRKQGLEGIRELLGKGSASGGSDPVLQHLGLVLKSSCGLLCDESSIVRAAVLQLFRAMLQKYTSATLEPHTGLVMMYVCSGITHLVESVRFHALDLLEAWISEKPLLVARYTPQVLPNLVSLVALHKDVKSSVSQHLDSTRASTRSDSSATSGKRGTGGGAKGGKGSKPERRLRLFRAVRLFLTEIPPLAAQAGGSSQQDDDMEEAEPLQTWGVRLPAGKRDLALCQHGKHKAASLSWSQLCRHIDGSTGKKEAAAMSSSHGRSYGTLCREMFPSLMEHWLQCVPSEYPSNSPNDAAAMEMILGILAELHNLCTSEELARSMGDGGDTKAKRSPLAQLQRYVVVHFPFRSFTVRKAGGVVHDPATALNRHVCLILCKYVGMNGTFDWAEKLFLYCTEQLSGGKEHADCLLTVVEKLIGLAISDASLAEAVADQLEDLLDSFTAFFFSRHFKSAAKAKCVAFILDTLRRSIPASPSSLAGWRPSAEVVKRWIGAIPKLLWQLKALKPELSASLLEILVLAGKSARNEEEKANYDAIQSSMVPFFFIEHKGQRKYGPFVLLDERCRRLAAETLFYFSSISPPMLHSLASVCRPLVLCTEADKLATVLFLLEVVQHRCEAVEELEYLIFLFKCVLEATATQQLASMDSDVAQDRVAAVTERVALYASLSASPGTVSEVLTPALCSILQDGARDNHPLRSSAIRALLVPLGSTQQCR